MNQTKRNELVNYLIENKVVFQVRLDCIQVKEGIPNNVLMELAVNYNAFFYQNKIIIDIEDSHEED